MHRKLNIFTIKIVIYIFGKSQDDLELLDVVLPCGVMKCYLHQDRTSFATKKKKLILKYQWPDNNLFLSHSTYLTVW